MGSRQEIIRHWYELDASTRLQVTCDLAVMELGLSAEEICSCGKFGGLLTHFRGMLRKSESHAIKAEIAFWRAWKAMEEAREEKLKGGRNHTVSRRKTTGPRTPTDRGRL